MQEPSTEIESTKNARRILAWGTGIFLTSCAIGTVSYQKIISEKTPSKTAKNTTKQNPQAEESTGERNTITNGKSTPVSPTAETPVDATTLKPFLKKYCIACHGPDEDEAGIRYDGLDYSISDKIEALHYQDILDELNAGSMPIKKAKAHPTEPELEQIIGLLTDTLYKAQKQLASTGGTVAMRRLNRREYGTTIRHLFGFEPPAEIIPQNDAVENFDTVGSRQAFNSNHFNLYYGLAQQILKTGFKLAGTRQRFETQIQQPETITNARIKKSMQQWKDATSGKVVRLYRDRVNYMQRPHVNQGVYLGEVNRHLHYNFKADPRGTYKLHFKAAIEGQVAPFRPFIRLDKPDDTVGVVKVSGNPETPELSTIEIRPNRLSTRLSGLVIEDRTGAWYSQYLSALQKIKGIDKSTQGILWIDEFQLEGPFYPEHRPFFDKLLCPDAPTPEKPSPMVWNDANAKELIVKFTTELFRRRTPSSDFTDGLHTYFLSQREKGGTFEDSMIDTLALVMASPSFIFLNEKLTEENSNRLVSNREKAIRLSYFLTSAPPDDMLFKATESNAPLPSSFYKEQIDRLLSKDNYQTLSKGFASQWADFVRLDAITVDTKKYPAFASGLRTSMKREVIGYFSELIEKNLPVANLIDSDFAVVNSQLAIHYGIPNVETNTFEAVKLPSDIRRGGFLTQAAFHLTGSNGERSSPSIRGSILMHRLLNSPVAPPPPNVPELVNDSTKPMTNRKLGV